MRAAPVKSDYSLRSRPFLSWARPCNLFQSSHVESRNCRNMDSSAWKLLPKTRVIQRGPEIGSCCRKPLYHRELLKLPLSHNPIPRPKYLVVHSCSYWEP